MANKPVRAATALTEAFFDLYPGEATEALEGAPVEEIVRFLETQPTRRGATVLERFSPQMAADCRITSYNVCYTKLLRLSAVLLC